MINMIASVVTPFLPIVWALIASAIYWRTLSNPWLFFITTTLALLGIQSVVSFVWDYFFTGGGYIVARSATINDEDTARFLESLNRKAVLKAAIVLVAAFPYLWWLKSVFTINKNP